MLMPSALAGGCDIATHAATDSLLQCHSCSCDGPLTQGCNRSAQSLVRMYTLISPVLTFSHRTAGLHGPTTSVICGKFCLKLLCSDFYDAHLNDDDDDGRYGHHNHVNSAATTTTSWTTHH